MKFTRFESHTAPGRPSEASWDIFATLLTERPPVIATPAQRPAFGPYVLRGPRLDVNVVSMSAQVLDYDRLSNEQTALVLSKVERFHGLVYTSYSHWTTKRNAFRVILPHETSVPAWRKHRKALERYIGVPSDPATHDPSRIFYIPCSKPGDPPPLVWHLPGAPFDPHALPGTRIITAGDFEALSKSLAYRARSADSPEKRQRINNVRTAIQAILVGNPYAEAGDIDPTLVSLIGHMKATWGTDVDTDSILEIMARSLDAMPPDRSLAHAREKIERLYATARKEERDAREERIKEHFERLGQQRSEPYTDDEQAWMRERYANKSPNSTVLMFGGHILGLTVQGYRDFGKVEMPDLLRALAPFDVDSSQSAPALLQECGQHVEDIRYSYHAPSYFDGTILTIPTAPLKPITPQHSPSVDAWLSAMVGDNAPLLRQWLSWLTDTRQPLICLYMVGATGAGKSVLIKGISRLWGTYVPLEKAFGAFNADLLGSPLVWGDEKFPKDNQGNYRTEEFRDFVQTYSHTINRKFRDHAKLEGYCRTVLTSNNENIFRVAANMLTQDDAEAIARRILRVPVLKGGRDYLRSVDIAPFIDTDMIAAHVLALPKHPVEGQFAISARGQELTDHIAASTHVGGKILQVCAVLLTQSGLPQGFIVQDGFLHVQPMALLERWAGDKHAPSPYHLAQALKSLCYPEKVALKFNNSTSRYYRIRTEILIRWADNVGIEIPRLVDGRLVDLTQRYGAN